MSPIKRLLTGHAPDRAPDDLADAGRIVDRAEHAVLLRRATYAAVTVATVLTLLKLAAWLRTDSVAMLSVMVDSMLDLVASLVTLVAVRHSLSPADREHRFGHGKAEALAGLGQATFVAATSTYVLVEAARRMARPAPIENTEFGLAVIAVAIVLTGALVALQRRVVRRTGSLAIAGDSFHYAGDLLTNIGVVFSLVLTTWFGWTLADPIFGAAISLFLYFNAWKIARRALAMLMDHELSDEDRGRILEIARSHPEVDDVHELRTRESGRDRFIQFHLEMSGEMTLRHAHEIADTVEARLLEDYPEAEIIIHQDPEGLDEGHREIDE